MNLAREFLETAARHPERAAIVEEDGRSISFARLAALSGGMARGFFRSGLRRGDHVLLAMPVGIGLFAVMAALWRLGAVIVFPEPALGLAGLRHAVRTVRPRALVTAGWYRLLRLVGPDMWRIPLSLHPAEESGSGGDIVEELPDEHPALVSFTTGSTGAPKAIVRSHGFLAAQNACVAGFLAPGEGRKERDLVAFPVFTVANLGMGVTSVLPGRKLLRQGRAGELSAFMGRHGVTRVLAPPAVCERLASGQEPVHEGLRAIFTGGGPVFPDLIRGLTSRYPGARLCAVYGSTEAEPIAWIDAADIAPEDFAAMEQGAGLLAGPPAPQTRLRILNDEIVVTGEHVNKGYLHGRGDAENKLRLDGETWHRTGDAGRLDEKGRLWLLGRHGAKAGRIWPFMIEAPARAWPGVRRAALVPGPPAPALAVEGDVHYLDEWRERARKLGVERVRHVARMPMDPRHASKIDLCALRVLIRD